MNQRRMQLIEDGQALDIVLEENLSLLTDAENAFYINFVEQVFQSTDRDELHRPQISSLAFDMILLMRLRYKQLKSSEPGRPGRPANNGKDQSAILETQVKTAEDRVRKQMDNLGISREKQLERGKILKSSPASILSGYLDEIEKMSPEQLDAWEREERALLNKMEPRIEKFILRFAPDIAKDIEDDIGRDGLPLTLDAALKRAGIDIPSDAEESNRQDESPF
jgi:hypothetical protein